MEAKFRVEDKVLDKSGKQWVIRHYRECEDGFYYGLYGKEDEVKESDLCLALPLGEYISDGVNGMSGISDPTGISGIFVKTTGNSILDEAKEIVDGLRADDYYDPVKNFRDISVMASIMTQKDISPSDCVKVLIAVKLTRESFKHKRDSLVDLCGYTYILDKIEES